PGARVENLSDQSRLREDIGLDSLGLVELQSAFEQRFAGEIPEDAWQQARTVGDLRGFIHSQPRISPSEPAAPVTSASPAQAAVSRQAGTTTIYPRWPWSAPIRWMRVAFLECV